MLTRDWSSDVCSSDLIFRVELMAPIRRGISTMKGYVFVGEKVVCEAEFMAQIVKNK